MLMNVGNDITSAAQPIMDDIRKWGGYLTAIVGIIMVIFAIYHISKRLMSRNASTRLSWVMLIAMFVIGALFAAFGIGTVLPKMIMGLDETADGLVSIPEAVTNHSNMILGSDSDYLAGVESNDTNPALIESNDTNPALIESNDTNPALIESNDTNPALIESNDTNPALIRSDD